MTTIAAVLQKQCSWVPGSRADARAPE